jgi:putative ABC transport system permease protein
MRADTVRHELRAAWRQAWRRPAGTAAAVVTLTLGIAASTAMFALVDGVVLRALPVHDESTLALVWRRPATARETHVPFSARDIEAMRRSGSRTVEDAAGVGAQGAGTVAMLDNGNAGSLRLAHVTGSLFDVLGSAPALGRALRPSDDVPGAAGALVISYGTWQARYGGTPQIIGRRLFIASRPFTIVGVMPPGLDFPRGTEAWTTVEARAATAPNDTFKTAVASELDAIVRLRTGTTPALAQDELRTLLPRVALEPLDVKGTLTPELRRFDRHVLGDTRTTILALFGAVVLVLLLASANVATLLLLRGEARVPELAMRAALGASRRRLAGQMLLESLAIASAAALASMPAATMLLGGLLLLAPSGLPRVETVAIDGRALAFCVATAVVASALAALAPMLAIARGRLVSSIGALGRATPAGATRLGRRALVAGQLALGVMVVATTVLLAQSLLRLERVDAGFDLDRLVVATLAVPQETSSDRTRHLNLLSTLVARLQAADAITSATPINAQPFSGVGWSVPAFLAEGQDASRARSNPALDLEAVHPGYFDTVGLRIVRGRSFQPSDRDGATPVAIVSEDVAARTWPGQDPVGHRLKIGLAAAAPWLTVVGVSRTSRYRDLTVQRPVLYVPAEQLLVAAQSLMIRTRVPLEDTAAVVRAAVHAVDPTVDVMAIQPLGALRQAPLARPRFAASLSAAFGAAALLLSTLGVFTVTATSVQQRRPELRVRAAVGATPAAIRRLIMREGLSVAAIGIPIGTAGALLAARWLPGLLFEVQPSDPPSFAGAALLLLLSVLLASAWPAWRASRMNPAEGLREN